MAQDTLLSNVSNLGVMDDTKVGNLEVGTQLGIGIYAPNLDSATPVVFTPTVLVVVSTPTMYDDDPQMARMIKAVMEGHAKQVTGLDINYETEVGRSPVGHDGQEMGVPLKVKRSQPNPSFNFMEVNGNLIWNMFRKWMCDFQDPDTNASQAYLEKSNAYVSTTYSMSMIAIQFDPTNLPENILDAVFYTNMFPTSTGELGIERVIGTHKTVERTIPFHAVAQHNDYVRTIARDIAEQLQMVKANYRLARTSHSEIGSAIADAGLQYESERDQEEYV